jgi:hypothetical protein
VYSQRISQACCRFMIALLLEAQGGSHDSAWNLSTECGTDKRIKGAVG